MKTFYISALSLLVLISCTDSKKQFVGNWIEIMPENPLITQGITLNEDGTATSIGMETLKYHKWKLENESVILWGESIGNGLTFNFSDTLKIATITPDSLSLSSNGSYQFNYYRVATLADVKPFNVLDSLKIITDLGDLMTRTFQGTLPAASCPGINYTVTIYNQQHSGDGVYNMVQTYLEAENGEDKSFQTVGRVYTHRDSTDNTLYQMVPFGWGETSNFIYLGDSLVMVGQDQKKIESTLNYTLTLKK